MSQPPLPQTPSLSLLVTFNLIQFADAKISRNVAKLFARQRPLEHSLADPVKYEAEKVYSSFGSPLGNPCGVLNRNGVFYASLKMQGQESPMEVALHGVRSEIEARQALATLSMLRGAECSIPRP